MNFIPNPLLYGVSEDFFSSFKLVITMRAEVQHRALENSVLRAAVRYPYFNVCPVKQQECFFISSSILLNRVYEYIISTQTGYVNDNC